LDQVCDQLAPDIEALDCLDEISHCKDIVTEGSSADRQIEIFRRRQKEGSAAALRKVCAWIAESSTAA
jgi:carboxylate-amine ligase